MISRSRFSRIWFFQKKFSQTSGKKAGILESKISRKHGRSNGTCNRTIQSCCKISKNWKFTYVQKPKECAVTTCRKGEQTNTIIIRHNSHQWYIHVFLSFRSKKKTQKFSMKFPGNEHASHCMNSYHSSRGKCSSKTQKNSAPWTMLLCVHICAKARSRDHNAAECNIIGCHFNIYYLVIMRLQHH